MRFGIAMELTFAGAKFLTTPSNYQKHLARTKEVARCPCEGCGIAYG